MQNDEKKDAEETVRIVEFTEIEETSTPQRAASNLTVLERVPLKITAELGRKEMVIKEVLAIGTGDVIELDKMVDQPVDLLVNDCYFATGEVVERNGYYGVRIVEIISEQERIDRLI